MAQQPSSSQEVALPETLAANVRLLSETELQLARLLINLGQTHLFDEWEPPGTSDAAKHTFFEQVASLDAAYPGGLRAYTSKARRLLKDSQRGANPMEGWTPSLPDGPGATLDPVGDDFCRLEELGLQEAVRLAFVIPAGGLGERLGFSGIKLALPAEISSGACVLQVYCGYVEAVQRLLTERLGRQVRLPIMIMTSDDTDAATRELLRQNGDFGLGKGQVTLLKQQRVPALVDAEGRFAAAGAYEVATKPHGHGDVHTMLHKSGLAAKWLREGRRWIMFFQDSSTLYLSTFLAALGASAERQLALSFVTMPRRAKMALGVLATMRHADGRTMPCIPIEYNQLEPLLAAGGGDVREDRNGPDGFSPFPGNTNALFVQLSEYVQALERTAGAVREFVNPKYTANRDAFLSPARLECMMQDYAWLLPEGARVGHTAVPLAFGYFPCKNDLRMAAKLSAKGVPPYSASTAEFAIYDAHGSALRLLGAHVEPPRERTFHGVTVPLGAAIVFAASFAPCMSVLKRKLPSANQIRISERSTLLVEGRQICIRQLELDGALEIRVCDGASLHVRSLTARNEGWQFDELAEAVLESPGCPEVLRMRGYTLRKRQQRSINIEQPGAYEVTEGELLKVGETLQQLSGEQAPPFGLAIGGALEGATPPPPCATWFSASLELAPGDELPVPLVLAEPSIVRLEVRPKQNGLYLALLPEKGDPVLPWRFVSEGALVEEVMVPGSGVYRMLVSNRSLFAKASFSARVEHLPATTHEEQQKHAALQARQSALEQLQKQDTQLASSEAELGQRLWEVQETRRRHDAMRKMLYDQLEEISDQLAKTPKGANTPAQWARSPDLKGASGPP